MTTWAATNSRITPWTMLMMSTGILGRPLHGPAPGTHDPEEQCRADDAPTDAPAEERDGDPIKYEIDEVLRGYSSCAQGYRRCRPCRRGRRRCSS